MFPLSVVMEVLANGIGQLNDVRSIMFVSVENSKEPISY
jgi:hypothetical protein